LDTLHVGQTQQYSTAVVWSDGQSHPYSVTFSATGGSITTNGAYTAGSVLGTFLVAAACSCSRSDTAAVVVGPSSPAPAPTLTQLTLNPSAVTLAPGGSQQFTVAGSWSDGSSTVPAVTYTATGGTISASGLYTAGTTTGTYRVIAVQTGGTKADTSGVTIAASTQLPTASVSVNPTTVAAGGSVTVSFTGGATTGDWIGLFLPTASVDNELDYRYLNGLRGSSPTTVISSGSFSFPMPTAAGSYELRLVRDDIAGCSCRTVLARSALVTVPRTLTGLTVSPKVASLSTGGTLQFTATAIWNDGSTTLPTLTWNASGGTISSSGRYTAGSVAGNYWATVSAAGLSDAAVLTISSPDVPSSSAGGAYPNRPTNYSTVLGEFDASAAVPAGGQIQRAVVGTPWSVIYDGVDGGTAASNWTRVSDATAPQSPPYVWQLHMPPGTWDTGHGFGNLFTALPPSNTELYLSISIKWDPNFEWHAVSNKFLWFDAGQILVQSREGSDWLHAEALDVSTWFDPQVNTPISLGVWHQVEVVLRRGIPGTIKVWMDGVLRTSYTSVNIPLPNNVFSDFVLTGHQGGGAFTRTRDSYYWIDHIFIAAP
jgi:hypothetical protein